MGEQRSMSDYVALKSWTRNPDKYAAFSGEKNRLGFRVPERYLDDRDNLKGTKIKLLCRVAGLPLMDRVGREAGWDKSDRHCAACNAGEVETIEHFVMRCQAYEPLRTVLFTRIREIISRFRADQTITFDSLINSSHNDQFLILMGKRLNNPTLENDIDMCVKRFLKKAWITRKPITDRINEVMGRHD